MLAPFEISTLLATMKPDAAKAFYQDVLGLKFVTDDGFALVFAGKNMKLRVSRVPAMTPAPHAVLAWNVDDIGKAMDALAERGVVFARFGFLPQDAKGVWSAPDGTKVAWFYDPDLNMLSLVQGA